MWNDVSEQHVTSIVSLLPRWFRAGMIFGPEDGGDAFLRNGGSYADYTA
jgi:hypothetical protein